MRRIIAAIATVLAMLLVIGCGGGPGAKPEATSEPNRTATPTPSSATFTVTGTIEVDADTEYSDQDVCLPADGYSDIEAGAQVEIQDNGGATLAIGELDPGKLEDGSRCLYAFQVEDVPEGESIYAVQIGNEARGSLKYDREQLSDPLELNIG